MNTQNKIKTLLFDDELGEKIAERIYRSMRFGRWNTAPEWEERGNSHAQNEARACQASIIEMVRLALRSE